MRAPCVTRLFVSPLVGIFLFVSSAAVFGQARASVPAPPSGPVIQAAVPGPVEVSTGSVPDMAFVGEEVRFDVNVEYTGARVSLRLLNPQPGMVFHPLVGASPPATAEVRWIVRQSNIGRVELVFEATAAAHPDAPERLVVPIRVLNGGPPGSGLLAGDVTGDGALDVVGRARNADPGLVQDKGAIYVWSGTSTPSGNPLARLRVPGGLVSERLGENGMQLADVTGDGILDVLAASDDAAPGGVTGAGAIYVFAGSAALSGATSPIATLAGPVTFDNVGLSGFHIGDVNADGILDVVAGAPNANVGGVTNSGAVFVWLGGPGLTGLLLPTATLSHPGAVMNDKLGDASGSGGELVLLGDVVGDGALDIVAAAPQANVGGLNNSGGAWVWAGGAGLSGTPAPTASLVPSSASANARLGLTADNQGLRLSDVTGDGKLDVIVAATNADVGGLTDNGAVYVWAGGSSLNGSVAETAALAGGASFRRLTDCASGPDSGRGFYLCDVTGDGTNDVVAASPWATVGGSSAAGAVYLWNGGSGMTGTPAPNATMSVPGAMAQDQMTHGLHALQVHEVTGDGILDVVAAASRADIGGVTDAGALYVFAGGGGLTGAVGPSATLTVPGAVDGDSLGGDSNRRSFQVADVSGDGFGDVVVAAPLAGVSNEGAIYVFLGGAGLSGAVSPGATLSVPGATPDDRLGDSFESLGVQLADVSGDGTLDVVSVAYLADVGGVVDAGAAYVFAGGAGLTGAVAPSATLTAPGSGVSENLGKTAHEGVQFADLSGDGCLDIVAGAPEYSPTVLNAGRALVWRGGSALIGGPAPDAILRMNPHGVAYRVGNEMLLADVDGDGIVDVLDDVETYDDGATQNVGALIVYSGGPSLTGTVSPSGLMTWSGAVAGDGLGD